MYEVLIALGVVVALCADTLTAIDTLWRWRQKYKHDRRMEAEDEEGAGGNRPL